MAMTQYAVGTCCESGNDARARTCEHVVQNIQGGVYGGMDGEGRAQSIGSISAELTMEAAGVSMMRALGHSAQTTQTRIPTGELVSSFLRS